MDADSRAELKKKIETALEKIRLDIERLEEATRPIAPENAIGRISRMDAINNKGVAEAALRAAKRKLASLKAALAKVDSPDFGNCSRCGQPIAAGRLMFMPESNECVRCAARG